MGYPRAIRVDQGSEFVSRDLDLWAYQNNVTLDFSRPGKPTDNAFIEAFNGRLRAECLNTHWFLSLADAREKLECWRRDYNEVRPHGAIGNKPPAALLALHRRHQPADADESRKNLISGEGTLGSGSRDRKIYSPVRARWGADHFSPRTLLMIGRKSGLRSGPLQRPRSHRRRALG